MDPHKIKQDFPILKRQVHGHPLVYLDSAATSQKPQQVIDAISQYYQQHNANVHRGIHTLGDESTQAYQQARRTVSEFIDSPHPHQLIFVRNTTEAINLVAYSWATPSLKAKDEIIITELDHHSNLIPWQQACQKTQAKLIYLPLNHHHTLSLELLPNIITPRTKLISLAHISNVLGTITDIKHLVRQVKKINPQTKILLDAAQSLPHMPLSVQELGIDFLAFSSHKMLGPMGIGGLWVKTNLIDQLQPFFFGGGMIKEVKKHSATWAPLPDKFDAGTPDVAGAVGLAAACDYLSHIGMDQIHQHEQHLTQYGLTQLLQLEEQGIITLYGPRDSKNRAGILTFNITGIHAHDTAQILDREMGIAVRSGHHCNQILLEILKVPATVRASFYLYNTQEEIDLLIQGIHRAREVFKL